jgi:hypothetical protein
VQPGVGGAQLRLQLLLALTGLAHPRDRAGRVRALPFGGGDLVGGEVARGAQRFQLGQQGAAERVELEYRVETRGDALTAAREGGADAVGVLADQPEVENRGLLTCSGAAGH